MCLLSICTLVIALVPSLGVKGYLDEQPLAHLASGWTRSYQKATSPSVGRTSSADLSVAGFLDFFRFFTTELSELFDFEDEEGELNMSNSTALGTVIPPLIVMLALSTPSLFL